MLHSSAVQKVLVLSRGCRCQWPKPIPVSHTVFWDQKRKFGCWQTIMTLSAQLGMLQHCYAIVWFVFWTEVAEQFLILYFLVVVAVKLLTGTSHRGYRRWKWKWKHACFVTADVQVWWLRVRRHRACAQFIAKKAPCLYPIYCKEDTMSVPNLLHES